MNSDEPFQQEWQEIDSLEQQGLPRRPGRCCRGPCASDPHGQDSRGSLALLCDQAGLSHHALPGPVQVRGRYHGPLVKGQDRSDRGPDDDVPCA